MKELSTANSFIVRIYRLDTEDPDELTGQVEMLDGAGKCLPFSGAGELTALLHSLSKRFGRHTGKT